ncbi:hypothetical protein GCM10011390_38680 [Aureimonas endophytica]|uniref:Glycosyltransferase involved in cell wall biosynthesis n=1 Tax=Aureimonas endophytica TaxID=2027858 RepID=A0A916ZWE8_9HYPH|nr:glycosyltransferase family 4 protein [Aureimonas endophytica]GGE15879.1 hypothetical protein GCM10011390_38680 [Aureimonas endophytica]
MRIAFYAPMKPPFDPVPSGEGRMAELFVAALRAARFTVEIASTFRAYDKTGDAVRQAELAATGRAEAARLLAAYGARPASERPASERPALWFTYHLYHKAPDHLGPVVAQALSIPYVVAEASHAPKQAGGRWDPGFRAAETAIRRADRIYGLNPADRACLAPLARPGALLDLPPFIDTAPFRNASLVDSAPSVDAAPSVRDRLRAELARRHGLDPVAPLILTVAMMRRDQKLQSYAVLAEAFARIAARPWGALLVGDGPARAEVERLMAPFGSRVALAGRKDGAALREVYAAADLYAWPSVKEAFGLAFIEAAASGLPIVAGRSGGIDHIVEQARTGWIVPAGDADALADGLAKLLDRPEERRAMGRAAAERALAVNDVAAAARALAADLPLLVSRLSEARHA